MRFVRGTRRTSKNCNRCRDGEGTWEGRREEELKRQRALLVIVAVRSAERDRRRRGRLRGRGSSALLNIDRHIVRRTHLCSNWNWRGSSGSGGTSSEEYWFAVNKALHPRKALLLVHKEQRAPIWLHDNPLDALTSEARRGHVPRCIHELRYMRPGVPVEYMRALPAHARSTASCADSDAVLSLLGSLEHCGAFRRSSSLLAVCCTPGHLPARCFVVRCDRVLPKPRVCFVHWERRTLTRTLPNPDNVRVLATIGRPDLTRVIMKIPRNVRREDV